MEEIDWPAQRPDLSKNIEFPIEKLSDELEHIVISLMLLCLDGSKSLQTRPNIVESLPRRVRAVREDQLLNINGEWF